MNKNDAAPLSFTGPQAVLFKEQLFGYFKQAGLNPNITNEWKQGIFRLFDIQLHNLPNLDDGNFIIASNHISDFDAVILGLIHPNIKIISKMGWASNQELMGFLKQHYDIVGVYREHEIDALPDSERAAAKRHNYKVTMDSLKYLKCGSGRHLLIFPQGTISDINKNSVGRVNLGFTKIAAATNASIVNIFTEYPGTDGPTRIVCSAPYKVANRNYDYRQVWLDDVVALQNGLDNLRRPVFSEKHMNNNNPNEPFF